MREMIGEYKAQLRSNSKLLEDFLSKMTEEEIDARIQDFWSIREHLEHLVETQQVLLSRMRRFIEEEHPVMKPYEATQPKQQKPSSIAQLLGEFSRLRAEQIALIDNSPDSAWLKTGEHPQFKRYSLEILVRHTVLHDGFHMWRIEELLLKHENLILDLESN